MKLKEWQRKIQMKEGQNTEDKQPINGEVK